MMSQRCPSIPTTDHSWTVHQINSIKIPCSEMWGPHRLNCTSVQHRKYYFNNSFYICVIMDKTCYSEHRTDTLCTKCRTQFQDYTSGNHKSSVRKTFLCMLAHSFFSHSQAWNCFSWKKLCWKKWSKVMKLALIYYIESFHDKKSHVLECRKFREKIKSHSTACR